MRAVVSVDSVEMLSSFDLSSHSILDGPIRPASSIRAARAGFAERAPRVRGRGRAHAVMHGARQTVGRWTRCAAGPVRRAIDAGTQVAGGLWGLAR